MDSHATRFRNRNKVQILVVTHEEVRVFVQIESWYRPKLVAAALTKWVLDLPNDAILLPVNQVNRVIFEDTDCELSFTEFDETTDLLVFQINLTELLNVNVGGWTGLGRELRYTLRLVRLLAFLRFVIE